MNEDRTIYDFLKKNSESDHISFHMPGHKSRRSIFERYRYSDFLDSLIKSDITEIPGADALYHPTSVIRTVMENYADLYGVLHTELLVGGSSAGIIASVLSCVPIGGSLILGRNSHHSVFSALKLGGINPVYIRPETDELYNLSAEIAPSSLETAIKEHPEASAVLITSPNYCGMLSDIAKLADIAHEHGLILIVDQAHGAHLRFFDYDAKVSRAEGAFIPHPMHAAESLGADIVINSTHKTLLSFTGSAILNICSSRVNADTVAEILRMVQTTSPSYILMGSLDINERIMREHGREIINDWKDNLNFFYRNAIKIDGLTVIQSEAGTVSSSDECFPLYKYKAGPDITKINLSMSELGLSGDNLNAELRKRGIVSEMVHGDYLLLMTGAANKKSDYENLLDALSDISSSYGICSHTVRKIRSFDAPIAEVGDVPTECELVPLFQSDGRVLYDPIISYPPGSPIVCPGEIMNLDIISYISDLLAAGDRITGVDEEGRIKVGANVRAW